MRKDNKIINKHWCGCVTLKKRNIIKFVKVCDKHKRGMNFCWIAIQS
jgi:hypothetical protein